MPFILVYADLQRNVKWDGVALERVSILTVPAPSAPTRGSALRAGRSGMRRCCGQISPSRSHRTTSSQARHAASERHREFETTRRLTPPATEGERRSCSTAEAATAKGGDAGHFGLLFIIQYDYHYYYNLYYHYNCYYYYNYHYHFHYHLNYDLW